MLTLNLSHPVCLQHQGLEGHPERPERLLAIKQMLDHPYFADLVREEAPMGRREDVLRAHPQEHLEFIESFQPEDQIEQVDADTYMNAYSLDAAMIAVGAATRAVDAVLLREFDNAFCSVRPPGHHAEANRAMGFCLFNSVAIAANYARDVYGADRVAVVDFDVHHGNGTQNIFWSDPDMFYGSSHQMPLFPGSGGLNETGEGNIFNAPLRAGDGSEQFREAYEARILPALDAFEPDILLISAGFDAHQNDPLGSLELKEEDFAWVTLKLMEIADRHADNRVISMLEGGYDLAGLASSAGVHLQALMRGTGEGDVPNYQDL